MRDAISACVVCCVCVCVCVCVGAFPLLSFALLCFALLSPTQTKLTAALKATQAELKAKDKTTSAAEAAKNRFKSKVDLLEKTVNQLNADKKKLQADYREMQRQDATTQAKLKKERDELRAAVKNTQRHAAEQVCVVWM